MGDIFMIVRKHKGDKTSYGIVGLGRFGYALAVDLAESGAELMVLDRNEEKIRELREYTENAIVTRSLDKNSLLETGIQNCDVAVVCIAEQMDTSILVTLNLVGMGIPKVIARANSAEHGEILKKLGAEVVYPEHDMALRLASRLENTGVLDFIQLSEQINISKLLVPEQAVGKTVQQINLRSHFGLNIIAIENNGNVIETVQPNYVFQKDDILVLSGSKEGMARLTEWVESH